MTEAAINPGLTRDLYISMGEPVENATDGAWGVRVYVKPFILKTAVDLSNDAN